MRQLADLGSSHPLKLVKHIFDGPQLLGGEPSQVSFAPGHQPLLRTTQEVLLDQLGLASIDQPSPDRKELMWGRSMRKLLELATRHHLMMSPQVSELDEEQHLVELRSAPGTVALQPRGNMHQQLGELLLDVGDLHATHRRRGVRRPCRTVRRSAGRQVA